MSAAAEQPSRRGLLAHRDYMRLFAAGAASSIGDQITLIALPAAVIALTGSIAQAGLISAMEMVPFLLALYLGRLIDMYDRRRIMVASQLLSVVALGTIPLTAALHVLSIGQLYVAAVLEGLAFVAFGSARMSVTPLLLPAALRSTGAAANYAADSFSLMIGPAIGGFLIGRAAGVTGPAEAYGLDAVSFLLCGIIIATIRTPLRRADRRSSVSVSDGMRHLFGIRQLRIITVFTVLRTLFIAPGFILLFAKAHQIGVTTTALGTIFSLSAIGGLVGSAIAVPIASRLPVRAVSVLSTVLLAVAYGLQAFAVNYAMLLAGELLYSLSFPVLNSAQVAYRLGFVPDEFAGRINAAYRMSINLANLTGLAVGGLVVGAVHATPVLTAVSLGLFATAVATAVSKLGSDTPPDPATV